MRLRLKTYLVYTLVVLSLMCLINVWMIVFVRTYVSNTAGPMEIPSKQRLLLTTVNLAESLHRAPVTWSFEKRYFESGTKGGFNFTSKYNINSTEYLSVISSNISDADNIKRETLNTKYFSKYNKSSTENIPQIRSAISDPGNSINDTLKTYEESSTASYVQDGKDLISHTSAIRRELVNNEYTGEKVNVYNEDTVNKSQEIYDNIIDDTLITNEINTSCIALANISNVTGRLANITSIYISSRDPFDITEHDDHIYLEENLDFKRMLEIDSEDASILERRWKPKHESNTSYADRKQVYNMYYRNIANQEGVDCVKIIDKDPLEITKAKEMMSTVSRRGVRPERYIHIKDCDRFKRIRGYIEHPLSESERNFPLAFGIIMYRDVEQAERLLRAIYRPHNYYCIHVDSKSDKLLKLAVESIVRCLPNVFMASRVENVTWGEFTVLQADLNCMAELWRYYSWKYYINLTGQEFPLKTNREIVKILEAMDGANIVDGTWVRANEKYFYRWTSAGNRPPHGIRPVKGSVHVLVNRHFVDFCLHDNRAIEFLAWLRKTQIPDETYFASLNHNPHLGIKGSFLGETEAYPLKPAFMRYKNWEFGHSTQHRNCSGKYIRKICILGVEDLHSAYHDIALFVNKFHLNFEYLGLDCLEEVLHRKTWQQYLDDTNIDVSYYKQLDYVKFKLS